MSEYLNEDLGAEDAVPLPKLEGDFQLDLKFFTLCAAEGITEIRIEYAGSGDSGQVQDILWFNGTGAVKNDHTEGLHEQLNDFACNLLSHCDIDWYNNDGGQGVVRIDVTERKVYLEHEHNITSTEAENHTYNF